MEVKKTSKADLENKRNIFIQLGLVVALGLVFYAFNLTDKVKSANTMGSLETAVVEEEIIPVTREAPPPPPPPPAPKTIEQLTIVEDDVELENDLKIENEEINSKTAITATPVLVDNTPVQEEEEIFLIVEKNPEFPGGSLALNKWLVSNVKYPPISIEMGIQGKVYVKFVVDKDGSISNATVLRGVDPALDQEALRVVRSMPKWSPGEQRGKPVKSYFNVPINFQLQ